MRSDEDQDAAAVVDALADRFAIEYYAKIDGSLRWILVKDGNRAAFYSVAHGKTYLHGQIYDYIDGFREDIEATKSGRDDEDKFNCRVADIPDWFKGFND